MQPSPQSSSRTFHNPQSSPLHISSHPLLSPCNHSPTFSLGGFTELVSVDAPIPQKWEISGA